MIVIAAAGNNREHIDSDLNNGRSIIVGAYNHDGSINSQSSGKCCADICSLGDDVYMENLQAPLRSGTSFATAFVTALVANYLHHVQPLRLESSVEFLKVSLRKSAENINCPCDFHKENSVALKMSPDSFMSTCLDHTIIPINTPEIVDRPSNYTSFVQCRLSSLEISDKMEVRVIP